jgi:oxygen-dependent protoporphyrinogen oxidase
MSARVAIVGGGITGLAAAYVLERAKADGVPVDYTLLEASGRFGGKIVTEHLDGFVIEGGPDSFLTQKPAALQLCQALGLQDELIPINEYHPSTYILHTGRLLPLPEGMNLMAPAWDEELWKSPLFTWPGQLRVWQERFIPPRAEETDESLADFVRRRLGQEALELLAEPLFAGVHTADAEQLSMAAAYPRFLALERQYGSLTEAARALTPPREGAQRRSPPAFMTLRSGLEALVRALVARLHGDLRLRASVRSVQPEGERQRGVLVRLQDGTSFIADAAILSTPASVTAKLVETWNPELARQLRQVRMNSSATVSLAYPESAVRHPLHGTGFLVPRMEPCRLTGCTWTSAKFAHRAPPGTVLLRAFVGGPRAPEDVDLDDEAMVHLVRTELQRAMGIEREPLFWRVYRWKDAHPQYDVGHLDRVAAMEQRCPPQIVLAGSSYRGLGLPDCIAQGEAAATAALGCLGLSA